MKADFHCAKKIFQDPLASADELWYNIGIFFGRDRLRGCEPTRRD